MPRTNRVLVVDGREIHLRPGFCDTFAPGAQVYYHNPYRTRGERERPYIVLDIANMNEEALCHAFMRDDLEDLWCLIDEWNSTEDQRTTVVRGDGEAFFCANRFLHLNPPTDP